MTSPYPAGTILYRLMLGRARVLESAEIRHSGFRRAYPIRLTGALQIQPISHVFARFRFQHYSDAGMYGSESLGIDLYLIEVGYRF